MRTTADITIRFGGLFALTLLGFSSCVGYKSEPLDALGGFGKYQQMSLASAGVSPHGAGWDMKELLEVANCVNPSIRRSRAELDAARAGIDVAGARPPVGLTMDLQHASMVGSPWTYGLLIDYTFETAEKRQVREVKARAEADVVALAISRTQWDVRLALGLAYVDWHAARRRQEVLGDASRVLTIWEAATKRLTELGETGRMEEYGLARERAALARDSAEADKQLGNATAALARALGVRTAETSGISLKSLPGNLPDVPSLSAMQKQAAMGRADVLEKLASYAVSEAALRAEVAKQYPDIRLSPGYSFDQGQRKWLLAAGTSILPDLNKSGIAQAEAGRKVASESFLETQSAAMGEVAVARSDYSGSVKQWHAAVDLVHKAERLVRAQDSLIQAGDGDRVTLLQAEFLAARDRVECEVALFQAWRSLVLLQDAVRSPLAEIF